MISLAKSSKYNFILLLVIILVSNFSIIGLSYFFVETQSHLISQLSGTENHFQIHSVSDEDISKNSNLVLFDEYELQHTYNEFGVNFSEWFFYVEVEVIIGNTTKIIKLSTSLNNLIPRLNISKMPNDNECIVSISNHNFLNTNKSLISGHELTNIIFQSNHLINYLLGEENLIFVNLATFHDIWLELNKPKLMIQAKLFLEDISTYTTIKQLKTDIVNIEDHIIIFLNSQSLITTQSVPLIHELEKKETILTTYIFIIEAIILSILTFLIIITLFLVKNSLQILVISQKLFLIRGIKHVNIIQITKKTFTNIFLIGYISAFICLVGLSYILSMDFTVFINSLSLLSIHFIIIQLGKNREVINNYEINFINNENYKENKNYDNITFKNDLLMIGIIFLMSFSLEPIIKLLSYEFPFSLSLLFIILGIILSIKFLWINGTKFIISRLMIRNEKKYGINAKYLVKGLLSKEWKFKFIILILISWITISSTLCFLYFTIDDVENKNNEWYQPLDGNYDISSSRNTIADFNNFSTSPFIQESSWISKGNAIIDFIEYPLYVVNNYEILFNSSSTIKNFYSSHSIQVDEAENAILFGKNIDITNLSEMDIKTTEYIINDQKDKFEQNSQIKISVDPISIIEEFPTISNIENSIILLYNSNYLSNFTSISKVFFEINTNVDIDYLWEKNVVLGNEGSIKLEPQFSFMPIYDFIVILFPFLMISLTVSIIFLILLFSDIWMNIARFFAYRGGKNNDIQTYKSSNLYFLIRTSYVISFALNLGFNFLILKLFQNYVAYQINLSFLVLTYIWVILIGYIEILVIFIRKMLS